MCNKPLRVTNPHYIKLADQLGVEISQFSNQSDYKLQVPCGKCVRCIRKRQQHWFVRAHNIYKRLGYDLSNSYFCTFTLKPEFYEVFCKEPYAFIRRFIDRMRKDQSLRYRNPDTGRFCYRKISFPYLFVLEVADGKRAAQRRLHSEHRLHLHAIMFGCPLPWWRVRHYWMSFGLAWVDPLRHFGGVRYAMKYITKNSPVHWNDVPKEILDLHGRLYVSHGFGRLSESEKDALRAYMMTGCKQWFSILIDNHPYSIPRYYKSACFTKDQIRCRNDSLIPQLVWEYVLRTYPTYSYYKKQLIKQSILWQ